MSSNDEISLPAIVRFTTQGEGGRITDPLPGIRPQIDLGKIQTSCVVQPVQRIDVFERGKWIEVTIHPMFYREVKDLITKLVEFKLYEGNHMIGEGKFLSFDGKQ